MWTPAMLGAAGLVAGVVGARHVAAADIVACVAVTALASAAAALFALRHAGRGRAVAAACCWAALGLACGLWQGWVAIHGLPRDHVARFVETGERDAVVTGWVEESPVTRSHPDPPLHWSSFVVRVETVRTAVGERTMTGRVRVFAWRRASLPRLVYGDRVLLSGRLSPPRAPTNPGETDWRERALETGVRAVLSVPRHGACERTGVRTPGSIWRVAGQLRARLHEALVRAVPGEATALVASVLLGTRDGVDPALRDRFSAAGTAHLLAISGLHLGLLAAVVGLVLRLGLRLPLPISHLGVMVFAVSYCVLAGARPPVVRATVMLVVVLAGWIGQREPHPLNSLALAAILIVARRPLEVFSTGFQFSFIAVLALLLLAAPLGAALNVAIPKPAARDPWQRRTLLLALRSTVRLVAASLVAWLATAPISAAVFHTFTPWAIVANVLCAVPFFLLLTTGLFAVAFAPLGGAVAAVAATPALFVADAVAALHRWLDALPATPVYVPAPGAGVRLGCYAALAAAAWLVRQRRVRLPVSLRVLGTGLAFCAMPLLILHHEPRRVAAGGARVTVLDVSAGSAAVVEGPRAVAVLDCGSSRIRAGARYVAPALWHAGHRRIDHLVLSHAHRDHVSGVEELLDRFTIGCVHVGAAFELAPRGARLVRRMRERGVQVRVAAAGDRIELGDGVALEVLAPEPGPLLRPVRSGAALLLSQVGGDDRARRGARLQNDASLVVRLVTAGGRVLFPGDVEERGTEDLLARGRDVAAEVLVAPHHGRRNERSRALCREVRPRLVIASNRAGWSDPATLCLYEDAGAEVRETGRGGAVCLELSAHGIAWWSFAAERDGGW